MGRERARHEACSSGCALPRSRGEPRGSGIDWRKEVGRRTQRLFAPAALSLVVLAGTPLAAAERPFELSLVADPGGSYSDARGVELDSGFGLGLGWWQSARWRTELRVIVSSGGSHGRDLDSNTYDHGFAYAFPNSSSWRPYVEFGAHYQTNDVAEPNPLCVGGPLPCDRRHASSRDTGGFVGGSVDWTFSRHAALRLDGRLLVYDTSRSGNDRLTLDQGTGASTDLTAALVLRF